MAREVHMNRIEYHDLPAYANADTLRQIRCWKLLTRAMDERMVFQHTPLDDARREIRLFDLLPGELNEPIRCTMRVIPLDISRSDISSVAFCALSYVWGDAPSLKAIYVQGQMFAIRRNLWEFLSHLRSAYEDTPLWADGLCIDQSNISERNSQVQIMQHIYRAAEYVSIWLGAPTNLTSDLFGAMNLDGTFSSSALNNSKDLFLDLLEREYWERLWIIQEVALARKVLLFCGPYYTSWDRMSGFLHRVFGSDLDDLMESKEPTYQTFYHLCQHRNGYRLTKRLDQLICQYSLSVCHDFHDHVYALLGLADKSTSFEVDYSIDLPSLLCRVIVQGGPSVMYVDVVNPKLLSPFGLNKRDFIDCPMASEIWLTVPLSAFSGLQVESITRTGMDGCQLTIVKDTDQGIPVFCFGTKIITRLTELDEFFNYTVPTSEVETKVDCEIRYRLLVGDETFDIIGACTLRKILMLDDNPYFELDKSRGVTVTLRDIFVAELYRSTKRYSRPVSALTPSPCDPVFRARALKWQTSKDRSDMVTPEEFTSLQEGEEEGLSTNEYIAWKLPEEDDSDDYPFPLMLKTKSLKLSEEAHPSPPPIRRISSSSNHVVPLLTTWGDRSDMMIPALSDEDYIDWKLPEEDDSDDYIFPLTLKTKKPKGSEPSTDKSGADGVNEQLLVKSGGHTDIEKQVEERNMALVRAVEYEELQTVRVLLKQGASPDAVGPCPCGSEGDYAPVLHTAARNGNAEILQVLLDAGSDANMGNHKSNTALTLVAEEGHVDCLEILLGVDGIEVNVVDDDGNSALLCAVLRGNMETTRMLLARGDVNREVRNKLEYTAEELAQTKTEQLRELFVGSFGRVQGMKR